MPRRVRSSRCLSPSLAPSARPVRRRAGIVLLVLLTVLAALAGPAAATNQLTSDVCFSTTVMPYWFTWYQSANQWMAVATAAHVSPSYSSYLGIYDSDLPGGTLLASSEIPNETNLLVRRHAGGGQWQYAKIYGAAAGNFQAETVWDDGQGALSLPVSLWKNYGGLSGECGVVRVWDLALTAGHVYSFRLTTTVPGDDLRMVLLLSGGQNGWLSRADGLFEESAVTGPMDPAFQYAPATTGTYAFAVFNNSILTSGGQYRIEISDLGTVPRPNLVIDHIDPDNVTAGSPVTATVYVRNIGAAAAGASATRVKLDGVTKCAAVSTPAIAAGATVSITCGLGTPAAGTHSVEACADVNNVVTESDETDNCRSEDLYVGAPDLVVTGFSPTSAPANQSLTVTVYVKNQGGTSAGASATRVRLDGVTKCAAVSTPTIAPGATVSVTCNVGTLTAGVHLLEATADVNGQVAESNEGNNTGTGGVTGLLPDYVVTRIDPDSWPAGSSVTATVTVRNQGDVAGGACKTRVRVDGGTACAEINTPALAAGATTTVTCALGTLTAGLHQIEACVDITGLVAEDREDNNCTTEPLTVTGPDLAITGFSSTNGVAGEPLLVGIKIANQGTAGAAPCWTRLWVGGVVKCDAISTPAIPSGGVITVQCNIGSYPAGSYSVEATVDATGLVAETDETNNSRTGTVTFKSGVTLVVDPSGGGPYPTIQAAIDAATDGVTIGLEDGEYQGPGNYDLDYHGKRVTIRSLSGDASQCTINLKGDAAEPRRGFYFHSGEDSLSTLEHVTIYGGYRDKGGGIYCDNSSPRLVGVEILYCTATDDGGGLACENYASPILSDCIVDNCRADDQGGGLYCYNWSSPRITGTRFAENTAAYRGGGAVFTVNCFPVVQECRFQDNSAQEGGGLMFVYAYGPVTDCLFLGNSAVNGGGMQCYGNAQCTIKTCTFSGNVASGGGSGLFCRNNSSPSVQRCILTLGGIRPAVDRYSTDCNPTFSCTDIYGNAAGDWTGFIAGQLGVNGNFSADPMFCAAGDGASGIRGESPCAPANNPACGLVGALPVSCNYVRVVRPDGSGDFPDIQAAIGAALGGDVILLADGTYTGTGNRNLDFGGKALTVRSQGGFPTTCTIDVQASAGSPNRAFYFHSGEDTTSVVEGIGIRNGYMAKGGAIYCNNSSPRLRNLLIFNSAASDDGGAVACENHASPIIEDCTFTALTAADQGGALFCSDWSSPRVSDCLFSYSSAGFRGGGAVFSVNCFPSLTRCTFHHNNAPNGGGLIFVYAYGPVDSCLFYANTATDGGGMQCYGNAQCTIRNCTFVGNGATNGGGIYCRNNSSPTIQNTLIVQGTGGGAVARLESNCNPTLTCCDLWGNTGGDWTGYVEAQYGVAGNVSWNPYFCSPTTFDYHLDAGSYCAQGNNPCGGQIGALGVGCALSVDAPDAPSLPVSFLGPIVPNPFTARTAIRFGLAQAAPVAVEIYDVAGRRVRQLAGGVPYPAGSHVLEWDARDDGGRAVRAGVYFCRLRAAAFASVKRMILLR